MAAHVVALAALLAIAAARAVASNDEGDALYALRQRLKDPNGVLQSWDPTLVNPCTWFRVTCNQASRVEHLRMATSGPSAGGGAAAAKDSWPELVGVSSEEAKKKIKEDKAGADVQVVPADAFVTMDYNPSRVRVFVDSNDKVAKAPRIG